MSIYSHRYILRVTIEFTTPFLVASGKSSLMADDVFVTDANGLPAIPGSSIAGALRAEYSRAFGATDAGKLFGSQDGSGSHGSKLKVSWGCIHDSRNIPVEGILDCIQDPVLQAALVPVVRDHVLINHKGVSDAEKRGKFNDQAVSAGHRFTFELELEGDENDAKLWEQLKQCVCSQRVRLGGKSRRGYGAFKIVQSLERVFNLKERNDQEAYAKHPVSLATKSEVLKSTPLNTHNGQPGTLIQLNLKPKGFWMFGSGKDDAESDMVYFTDSLVVWNNDNGTVREDVVVIPGSAVKGAIAHRLVYHYNRLKKIWAKKNDPDTENYLKSVSGENCPAIRELFGYCDASGKSKKGIVLIDDCYLSDTPPSMIVHHVGIDRYTGGARDGCLFSEKPLWQNSGEAVITIYIRIEGKWPEDKDIKTAFKMTLEDLAEGRLQLGAGSGRGNGYFTGTIEENLGGIQ